MSLSLGISFPICNVCFINTVLHEAAMTTQQGDPYFANHKASVRTTGAAVSQGVGRR